MRTTILRQCGRITHVVVRLSLYEENADFVGADEDIQDARIEGVVRAALQEAGEDPASWQVNPDCQAEFSSVDGRCSRVIEVWRS